MFRFTKTIVAAAAAAAVIVPAGGARADSAEPLAQLRIMCEMKTGDFWITPYHLARCQDVRANKGFDLERSLCSELGGALTVSSEFSRNNRASWGCVALIPSGT